MICGFCGSFRAPSVAELQEHWRAECGRDPRWERVVELRSQGQEDSANRLARRILGVSKEMSEEAKEKLRIWKEEHAQELAERKKTKAVARQRLKAMMRPPRRTSRCRI